MRVQLGEHRFDIPKQNMRDVVPFWLKFIPGLAPSRGGLLYTIDAEEVEERIPAYQVYDGDYRANLSGLVDVLSDAELRRHIDPDTRLYSDVLHRLGRHEEQFVMEWREEFGFYVAHQEGDDVFWDLLRMPPDSLDRMPDNPFGLFWVAGCLSTRSPLTQTGRISRCTTHLYYGNLHLSVTVRGFNLHLIDEVRSVVLDIFKEWEVQ